MTARTLLKRYNSSISSKNTIMEESLYDSRFRKHLAFTASLEKHIGLLPMKRWWYSVEIWSDIIIEKIFTK